MKNTDVSLSLVDLILKSDFVIMVIMVLLVVASIVSWGIIFERYTYFVKLNRSFKKFEKTFWSGVTLEQIHENLSERSDSPIERIFIRIMNERDRCLRDSYGFNFTKERIAHITQLSLDREAETP